MDPSPGTMDTVVEVFLSLMTAGGFVLGIGVSLMLLGLGLYWGTRVWCRVFPARKVYPEPPQKETAPYDEQVARRMAHRYIGVADCDPRSPAFARWASHEYDELFGTPSTAPQLYEKKCAILDWAHIALDWLANPPAGRRPEMTATEAAWFYQQLQSYVLRVPGVRREEPAS